MIGRRGTDGYNPCMLWEAVGTGRGDVIMHGEFFTGEVNTLVFVYTIDVLTSAVKNVALRTLSELNLMLLGSLKNQIVKDFIFSR